MMSLPFLFSFTTSTKVLEANCPPPVNLNVLSQSSNSISFGWNHSTSAEMEYQMYYIKDGNTSPVYSTVDSGHTFSNLSSGTYHFYFYSVCTPNATSIIIEETIFL